MIYGTCWVPWLFWWVSVIACISPMFHTYSFWDSCHLYLGIHILKPPCYPPPPVKTTVISCLDNYNTHLTESLPPIIQSPPSIQRLSQQVTTIRSPYCAKGFLAQVEPLWSDCCLPSPYLPDTHYTPATSAVKSSNLPNSAHRADPPGCCFHLEQALLEGALRSNLISSGIPPDHPF